jgi:hypothetical protein
VSWKISSPPVGGPKLWITYRPKQQQNNCRAVRFVVID